MSTLLIWWLYRKLILVLDLEVIVPGSQIGQRISNPVPFDVSASAAPQQQPAASKRNSSSEIRLSLSLCYAVEPFGGYAQQPVQNNVRPLGVQNNHTGFGQNYGNSPGAPPAKRRTYRVFFMFSLVPFVQVQLVVWVIFSCTDGFGFVGFMWLSYPCLFFLWTVPRFPEVGRPRPSGRQKVPSAGVWSKGWMLCLSSQVHNTGRQILVRLFGSHGSSFVSTRSRCAGVSRWFVS